MDHRRRSVDLIIEELRQAKEKYHIRLIDFEDNILYSNKAWFREFAVRYKTEIGVPYTCMGHPLITDDEIAALLASSGCYRVQLGIQSMDEKNRKALLHRPETNEQVRRCFRALDKYKVRYSIDHIFGLPNERDEQHLFEAAWEYSQLRTLHKANFFFLTCYPKTPMVRYAIQHGMIKAEDEQKINAGEQDDFLLRLRHHHRQRTAQIVQGVCPILPHDSRSSQKGQGIHVAPQNRTAFLDFPENTDIGVHRSVFGI